MLRVVLDLGTAVMAFLAGLLRRGRRSTTASARRFALVSHAVPPMWSGQAVVLGRILSQIAPDECVVITTAHTRQPEVGGPPHTALPAEPFENLWLRRGLRGDLSVLVRIFLRGFRIAAAARRRRCRVVVACTGDLIDLPASAVACAMLRLPLVPYYFDDYLNQWRFSEPALERARILEPFVLRRSATILVPNEILRDDMRARSECPARIVRNPASAVAGTAAPVALRPQAACTIVYTGAVYHVNHQAFRTLIAAMDELPEMETVLHIYTAQDPGQLAAAGIHGSRVHVHAHVEPDVACGIQRAASILFMGFSFDSAVPEIVRTSAPGKLGDYLASGVPILALTPAGSFLQEFLAKRECGLVVDRDAPDVLAAALRALGHDQDLRRSLVGNALEVARREFTPAAAASEFTSAIDAAGHASRPPTSRHRKRDS